MPRKKHKTKKDMSEKKQSSSLERKVEGYLKPTNHAFIVNYVKVNECSKSQAMNDAVKALRDSVTTPIKK